MKDEYNSFSAVILMILMAVVGIFAGCGKGVRETRREAVEVGVAEYYIDADYHKRFRWKTNTAQIKPQ